MEYETPLEDIFQKIVNTYKSHNNRFLTNSAIIYDKLTTEQLLNVGKQFVADMREINHNGETIFPLENYLFESSGTFCVFYQTAEVKIPANSSITLTMEYKKYAGIKKIEKNNYDGLEIMTSLSSDLVFKSQTLTVLGLDKLTVSKHTTGKELEQGQYEVELKEECFEIYLEVPERESSGLKRKVEAVGF